MIESTKDKGPDKNGKDVFIGDVVRFTGIDRYYKDKVGVVFCIQGSDNYPLFFIDFGEKIYVDVEEDDDDCI